MAKKKVVVAKKKVTVNKERQVEDWKTFDDEVEPVKDDKNDLLAEERSFVPVRKAEANEKDKDKEYECYTCKDTGAVPQDLTNGVVTRWKDCTDCIKCPLCKDGKTPNCNPRMSKVRVEEMELVKEGQ